MTMTEKILARASNKSKVSPGENLWVNTDVLMTHDVCGPGTIGIFKKEFGADAKVRRRERTLDWRKATVKAVPLIEQEGVLLWNGM